MLSSPDEPSDNARDPHNGFARNVELLAKLRSLTDDAKWLDAAPNGRIILAIPWTPLSTARHVSSSRFISGGLRLSAENDPAVPTPFRIGPEDVQAMAASGEHFWSHLETLAHADHGTLRHYFARRFQERSLVLFVEGVADVGETGNYVANDDAVTRFLNLLNDAQVGPVVMVARGMRNPEDGSPVVARQELLTGFRRTWLVDPVVGVSTNPLHDHQREVLGDGDAGRLLLPLRRGNSTTSEQRIKDALSFLTVADHRWLPRTLTLHENENRVPRPSLPILELTTPSADEEPWVTPAERRVLEMEQERVSSWPSERQDGDPRVRQWHEAATAHFLSQRSGRGLAIVDAWHGPHGGQGKSAVVLALAARWHVAERPLAYLTAEDLWTSWEGSVMDTVLAKIHMQADLALGALLRAAGMVVVVDNLSKVVPEGGQTGRQRPATG